MEGTFNSNLGYGSTEAAPDSFAEMILLQVISRTFGLSFNNDHEMFTSRAPEGSS